MTAKGVSERAREKRKKSQAWTMFFAGAEEPARFKLAWILSSRIHMASGWLPPKLQVPHSDTPSRCYILLRWLSPITLTFRHTRGIPPKRCRHTPKRYPPKRVPIMQKGAVYFESCLKRQALHVAGDPTLLPGAAVRRMSAAFECFYLLFLSFA